MSNNATISRKHELPLSGDNTSIFLQVMISIAVFIFALTLSGVLSINSMLQNWNESILGSLTIQIMPINDTNREQAMAQTLQHQKRTLDFLATQDFVEKATPLSDKQLDKLIRPWLGDGVNLDKLPIPRLIDVKIKSGSDVNFLKLAENLLDVSSQASLDNHKLWLNKLINFADGLKMLALTILALVILINSGAIFYTTQVSLGLHRNIIEILHTMGAKDTYIAQQYARRIGKLGLIGGLAGVVLAAPTILFIGSLATQIEGGIISEAGLSFSAWMIIFTLPLFACTLAMTTAYYTVKRTLEKML